MKSRLLGDVSKIAWLTSDDTPGSAVCFRVFCPTGEAYEAALRGAIAELELPENWEQAGTTTPEEAAYAFVLADVITMQWERCSMAGEIILWPGETIPDGWLVCDGSDLEQAEYPELYAILGTTWGTPGGSLFTLPDLRQRVPIGVGDASGLSTRDLADVGGAETVSLTSAQNGPHTHTIPQMTTGPLQTGGGFAWAPLAGSWTTSSSGSGSPHENMPPFAAVNFIIRVR